MASSLTPVQLEALFDILTHTEAFNEIRDMRYEQNIGNFGPPFTPLQNGAQPAFPLLQLIVSKFIESGLYTEQGWADMCTMLQRLCAANLSDSYDKGFLGLRKNAAAGLSAGVETIARAVLAGIPRDPAVNLETLSTKQYDRSSSQQLEQAFLDAAQGILYGDLLDRLFQAAKASPNVDDLPPVAKAALDFLLVNSATMMHYSLVIVPDGQNLVKMADTIDTLTPYTILKQTVRMGNVEGMLKGLMKVMLAKVGDKNLIQTMASRSLKLDLHDLEKRAEKIKKKGNDGKGLAKEIATAIDDYVLKQRSQQEQIRHKSQTENKSIVAAILAAHYPTHPPQAVQDLSADQHTLAQEYLAVQLSIRDRLEGVQTICKEKPDLLSPIVQEQMALITPFLKSLHDGKFDIGQIVSLAKVVVDDFIKTAKITKNYTPTVADFYGLAQRHVPAVWKLLSEGANKCPDLYDLVYRIISLGASNYRTSEVSSGAADTGAMTSTLHALFASLPAAEQAPVQAAIDVHATYLAELHKTNQRLLQDVLDKKCTPDQVGPNPALPRWQALLDATLLTPAEASGRPRTGRSVESGAKQGVVRAPDSSVVSKALSKQFREHIAAERKLSLAGLAASLPQAGGYAKNTSLTGTNPILSA